ncbi:hypothetical protein GKZ68_20650 (plasmid) [Hymenobacter sp. BRD128]|uniref:hypothetical protein n=1 Tax=Hymenobacter sp. BRD128 TaxID=2675878 RepID=UPI00156338EB|nr:hypothetical protein [Hymenobacter sp. BRD128]QKG59094.1 hypothetical protein GKZ68_20650 [Hymenobacter sp. BRD128]
MAQLYLRTSLNRFPKLAAPRVVRSTVRHWLTGCLAAGYKHAHGAWLVVLVLVSMVLPYRVYADSGLYKDFVILQAGSSTVNTYYYTNLSTSNYQYQGANLGSFTRATGGRLVLEGGEVNTYQHNGVNMQGAQLLYRVYLTGTTPGLFSSLDLPYLRAGQDGDAGNKEWTQVAAGIDLLSIAAQPGTYVLEVYLQAQGSYGGQLFTNYDGRYGANYQATFTVTSTLPLNNPSDNSELNWTTERSFDGNGNEVEASRQFTDGLGRPTQAQARNAATQQVFAAQTVYNTGGQPVLQTLAAPINNQSFNYKEGFVTAGGQNYGPGNFEDGLASNPTPVDATDPGTLGYYFSQLNAAEPLTPITSYPYSLVEPYEGPLGGTRRAAGPGDELRMGKGREAKGRDFPLRKEFDSYLSLRPQFVPGSSLTSLEYEGSKSVSVNADGRESIVVTNKEGQAIISCLSGPQYPALPVDGYISAEGPTNSSDPNAPIYQDIHLPAAGPQDVKFTMDASYTGGGRVLVVNLLTNDTTSYPIKPATAGAAPSSTSR